MSYGLRKCVAFDSVPRQCLLTKLESIGIVGEFLKRFMSFLTGRKHKICADAYAKNGIPQGSVLGPIVFVIFINDMPNAVKNSFILSVDDAKLYRPILIKEDASSLQQVIDSLVRCL